MTKEEQINYLVKHYGVTPNQAIIMLSTYSFDELKAGKSAMVFNPFMADLIVKCSSRPYC